MLLGGDSDYDVKLVISGIKNDAPDWAQTCVTKTAVISKLERFEGTRDSALVRSSGKKSCQVLG
jgi:hypothetical protein